MSNNSHAPSRMETFILTSSLELMQTADRKLWATLQYTFESSNNLREPGPKQQWDRVLFVQRLYIWPLKLLDGPVLSVSHTPTVCLPA